MEEPREKDSIENPDTGSPEHPGQDAPPPHPSVFLGDSRYSQQAALRSLALIFAFLTVAFLLMAMAPYLPRPNSEDLGSQTPTSSDSDAAGQNVSIQASKEAELATGTVLIVSVAALAAFLFLWLSSVPFREQLGLRRVAQRVEPKLWLIDLMVAIGVWWSLLPPLAWLLVQASPPEWWSWDPDLKWWKAKDGAGIVLSMVAQFSAYAIAMACVISVLWVRGGRRGAAGIWPFWTNETLEPRRTAFQDVTLATAFYLLFVGPLWMSNALNVKVIQWLKIPIDQNPLVGAFFKEERTWALVAMVLMVTIGAAIAEEFFFRGVLYTLLRRYVGRWAGAIAASLAFAVVHDVKANVLSLFLLGMLLTWLYERSGNLLAPIIMHALNNAVTLMIVRLSV